MGKCPKCGSWNSLEEVVEDNSNKNLFLEKSSKKKPREYSHSHNVDFVKVEDVETLDILRVSTGYAELDRVLGGGVLKGAVTLVGGEPGIGKSTLLMEILGELANKGYKVAYISGEESLYQVAERAKRILTKIPENLYLAAEVDIASILNSIEDKNFEFLVFDSIQAFIHPDIEGVPGGVTQTKAIASIVSSWAKKSNKSVFLIGQVTKSGLVAGPKSVEHIVDTVIYLESTGIGQTRIVRSVKNRFGEVGEVGFLDMKENGFVDNLEGEKLLLNQRENDLPGSAFGVVLHGKRPLMVQIQSLVSDSQFALPRRVVEDLPKNKVEILAAVVNKKVPKVYTGEKDIFIKAIGGVLLKDSGLDLAIVASMISGCLDKSFINSAFIGEVGLLGEIQPCLALDLRIKEAKKMGFKKVYSYKNVRHIREILER